MKGCRDKGMKGVSSASHHLWLTVPSEQPPWATAWERESCAHPQSTQRAQGSVYTHVHTPTHLHLCRQPGGPAAALLAQPQPHTPV